jgi:predicted nucleotidyltransferase
VDFVGFKQDLEKLFNRNIDVVTEKSLHWLIRQDALNEARPL